MIPELVQEELDELSRHLEAYLESLAEPERTEAKAVLAELCRLQKDIVLRWSTVATIAGAAENRLQGIRKIIEDAYAHSCLP